MDAREATYAKLQELLNRPPPLPGRGILIRSSDQSLQSLNNHIDIYNYVMDHDEITSKKQAEQFQALHPPRLTKGPSAEVIYARKSRDQSPSVLERRQPTWNESSALEEFTKNLHSYLNRNRSRGPNQEEEDNDENSKRPNSASKVIGLSLHLQLDQEKFVERRRSFDMAERKSKEKQEAYEEFLKQRLRRASQSVNESYLELAKRNEDWLELCKAKREWTKERLAQDWQAKQQEFRDRLLEHINKPLPKSDHTWLEIEYEEEERRRERIEKRMKDLHAICQSPFPWQRRDSSDSLMIYREGGVVADHTIAEYLQSRSRPPSRSRSRGQFEEPPQKPEKVVITPQQFLDGLEQRQREFEGRRSRRLENQRDRELMEIEAKQRAEMLKMDQLLRTGPPVGYDRRTKAVEMRDKAIKARIQRQEQLERLHTQKQYNRQKHQRKVTTTLKAIITENEAERKSRHGDHIELNKTNELSAERSRKGIDSFLESYRSNKQQIERALDNRPTLLQRHQENITQQQAAKRAATKIIRLTRGILPSQNSQSKSQSTSTKKSTHKASKKTSQNKFSVQEASLPDTDSFTDEDFLLASAMFSNHK